MRTLSMAAAAIGAGLIAFPLVAQQPAPAAPAAAPATAPAQCPAGMTCTAGPSPASELGIIAFPGKGQTKEQQLADEQECYAWAQSNTGIDPKKVKANPDSAAKAAAQKMDSAATGAAVVGAAKGAAAGAAIGAVTGNAGEGAGVGAVSGAIAGRRAKKAATAQAAQAGAAQAQAQAQALIDKFKKAMSACLEGKGYSVK
jgi:hypothetical protein